MKVHVRSTTMLEPEFPALNPNLQDQLVPLTIFDKAAMDFPIAILHAYRAPTPSNATITAALSQVLSHYPHLAGRLVADDQRRSCMHINNAGVRVVEADIHGDLEDHLPLVPSPELTALHPKTDHAEEILQIQLNRFACGGLVIGLTVHHQVGDGLAINLFLTNWARVARGLEVDPVPLHDRAIFVPRRPYSTFECVMGHLWRSVTMARMNLEGEVTELKLSVNGRARLRPGVPMEYFGNLVLWASPRLEVGELLSGGTQLAAKAIREAVIPVDDAYFRSFIDFGATVKEGEEEGELKASVPPIGCTVSPNLEVDSWLRFPFSEIDFGGGGPCAVLPAWLPVEGLVVLMQSLEEKGLEEKGGVDAVVSLSQDAVPLFRKICHEMD
ncbi:Acetyl-CoA-benzylalcohol acetyltransferase [Nymphaea thermarum]|nr:Acetyl-CoA-benzylalcohol acetyltransferase [Nymphaea thermarum]